MKVDRTKLEIVDLHDRSDDAYWWKQSPIERLKAVEINREAAFGKERCSQRLQRVLEIVERSRS